MRDYKSKSLYHFYAGCVLSLFITHSAFSQGHLINQTDQVTLNLAAEQFHQGNYQLSLQSARRLQDLDLVSKDRLPAIALEQARYYEAVSRLKLSLPGADDSAAKFLSTVRHPAYRQRVSFNLAQYYFRHNQLTKAIAWYESAAIGNLTNEEIADMKFELAYCYFNSRRFEQAEPLFASIREVQGKYYIAGNYYYALLAYNDSKYEEALASFQRIENEEAYRNIVPYYIAEIYYFMGNRAKALDLATALTKRTEKLYYDNELHLLAAQVLFEDQRYEEAIPYFEHYYDASEQVRKEELYEMAYSYYRVGQYSDAIGKFRLLNESQDSLGQTAMYLLGDCYLRTGDKKSARNAFSICAEMPYNAKQQEASLLLYGKLSYDLGYNDAAIRGLSLLISDFPNSVHVSEARTVLSDLLMRTNNYADALETLKDATERSSEYWKVQQKVTYGYAMQRYAAGSIQEADSLLAISLSQAPDRNYEAAAWFWRGDIASRSGRPANAISYLQKFLAKADEQVLSALSPGATISNAYMTMGYAAMDIQDYAAAQNYFSRSRQGMDANGPENMNAVLREADAAFMQKSFRDAFSLYDRVIAASIPVSDYARIQKAKLLGLQNKTQEKMTLLQQVVTKSPASAYSDDARYELAITQIEEEKYGPAVTTLLPLTEARGTYTARSWLKLGFAYQQQNSDAKAIEAYKHLITDFAASEERTTALEALRSLYVENNQPEAYAALLKEYDLPAAGGESPDATFYAAAEAQIAAGKWANAKQTLTRYLESFPNGSFTTKAHYYKAESHYQLKEFDAALAEYAQVLALPWNEYSEISAKRAADLAFKAKDYTAAGNYYRLLRNSTMDGPGLQLAYTGLMRSAFSAGQFDQAGLYADTLLTLPELSAQAMTEVQFLKAGGFQKKGQYDEALVLYKTLTESKDEAISAEARYRTAELYFIKGDMANAEKEAGNTIRLGGNAYWEVRSYLLISDIFIKQKDYFNAKATLNSVVRNTKNQELKKEATQKLEEVKKLEKRQSKLRE